MEQCPKSGFVKKIPLNPDSQVKSTGTALTVPVPNTRTQEKKKQRKFEKNYARIWILSKLIADSGAVKNKKETLVLVQVLK